MFLYEKNNRLVLQFEGNKPLPEEEATPLVLEKNEEDGKVAIAIGDEVVVEGDTEALCVIGDREFTSLVGAVKAAKDGDEIKLLKDQEGAGIALWEAEPKSIAIDFNGFTYTANDPAVGSKGTETQAFHLEKGSAVRMKNGAIRVASSKIKMMIQNYCNLTLTDMDLDASDQSQVQYVCSNNFGSMNVHGNTCIKPASGRVAFDLWFGLDKNGSYDDGVSVTFAEDFSGTVDGKMEYGAQNHTRVPEWMSRTALVIRGGTFNGDIVASSSGFDFNEANISVYAPANCPSSTFDPFRKEAE